MRRTGCGVTAFGGAAAAAGAGFGAGFVTTGGGVTRRMTIGFGFAGTTWTTCAAWTTWATGSRSVGVGVGVGRGRARTIAGCEAPGSAANDGVCTTPGPARMRGNATAPATALASSTAATTPLVIALMVPTPNADGITRTRYRQVGTRA